MAISFPNNPALNQTYTLGVKTWIWNGYAWDLVLANTVPIYDFAGQAFNTANAAATLSGWAENDLVFSNSAGYIANSGINYYTSNSVLLLPSTTTINAATGNVVFSDATLLLQGASDQTKYARFSTSGQATGTTVVYTLPAGSSNVSTLADLQSTQTFSGLKTFSGSITASGGVAFTTAIGSILLGTSLTSGILNLGSTSQTGQLTIGPSACTHTTNISSGTSTSGITKTINFGEAGRSGSVTNINIGSSESGSKGTTKFNTPNVIITAANTAQSSVSLLGTIPSTSNTTGTLIVSGGIGVAGSIYAANINAGGLDVINYINSSNTQLKAYNDGAIASANTQLKAYVDASITYGAGVNTTQNTNITTATNLAQGAYDKANTDYTTVVAVAGDYGSTTITPVIKLAANGRVTSVTNTSIAFPVTSVGGLGVTGAVSNTQLSTSVTSGLGYTPVQAGTSTIGQAPTYATMQGGRSYLTYDMTASFANLYETRFVNLGSSTNVPAGMSGMGYWFGMGAGDTGARGFDLVGTSGSGLWYRERSSNTWNNILTTAGTGTNLTALNASNLTSGTVSTARLGTGTANANTYLAGDSTWKTISASASSLSGTTLASGVTASSLTSVGTLTSLTVAQGNTSINLSATGSGYIGGSTQDGADSGKANVRLSSWWGIGFSPSITGQAVPVWENAVWFDVRNGSISARSSITAYSSDKRLKTKLTPIGDAIEKVSSISGYEFDWDIEKCKSLGFEPQKEHEHGFVAQEIQKIVPDAVSIAPFDDGGNGTSKSGENYLTVKYERLVPLLVEAIKEQQKQIDELKSIISSNK